MEKGLEGPGRVPRIVQVMYFKGGPRQPNQQPEVGLTQQWEAQWQEFLNTLQPAHTGWGNLQLTDMAPWDDARAFLTAFEQVAEACQWPREEWVRQLLPALRGGMEQSFCRLDARDRTDYVKVKAAILRADAFRMEMKRQHFRQCSYQELEGPRRVYTQLQDLCRQWLKPESHTKEQILEMIIQEQLLGMLPAEAQNWVRECGPKDCVEMVALAEEFLMGPRHAARTCDWQVPLPEASGSSLEPEGRQRQHYHPGASEMTPTRNSVLAQPSSSAGLEMAETGTPEGPVHVKDELGLDQKPIHWEVMRGSGSSSTALEGLLVPTPEVNSQTDQPQATFQERPVQGDQIPDFGGRIIGEIKIETFQQAISEAEDDFETLQGEESSGATSLSSESSPLDPEKRLGARQQGEAQKKKCTRRRRRAFHKKNKYYPTEKKHACPECGHKSYFYSDLLRHMKTHAAKELLKCLECGKTYRGRSYFENHLKIHLPLDDTNRCVKRAKKRKSGGQTKEEYICFKCGIVKSSQSGLTEHMKVHTDERPYQCLECGKLFKWQSNLSRHRRLHTYRRFSSRQLMRRGASESNQGQSNSTQAQKSPLELLGELSTVSLIAVSEANPVSRLPPRKSQEVERSQMYGLKTLQVMLKKLPSPQKGKSKGPDVCDRRATELSKTIERRTVRTGERSYACSDCGKAFSSPSNLCRHEKGTACRKKRPIFESIFAEEKIPCRGEEEPRSTGPLQQSIKLEEEAGAYPPCDDQLPPTVSQEEGQMANEASKHRNTTMHACTKCGYQAEKLSDILKHFRVHNKEKPYRYLDCGNSFGWSSTLMRHQQTHQQTPVPNVVIAECDVTLSDDEELINFLGKKPPGRQEAGLQNGPKRSSKRSPSAAPPSSAASRLEASLLPFRSRERNGKGQAIPHREKVKKNRYEGLEKKHLCLDCGHRTYYLSDLMRHKRAHPNGKPYKCPDCEKIFVQPSFLKLHLKTHKPGKKPMKRLKAPQGERKYTCSKCGHKTYKLSTHLLHMRAHAGERETSYICDECGKDFKRSSNLSRHKRIHSLNNEEFRIRRPSFTHDKEINRSYEEPKKTTQVQLKKIGRHSPALTTSNIAALRKQWRNYKRQQRQKAAEKRQKMGKCMKENIGEKKTKENVGEKKTKENVGEKETQENIGEKEMKENIGEKETQENIGEKETKENTGEKESKENTGEKDTKENIGEMKMNENIGEKETKEKNTPELSLRARLEKFAYSKNRGKEDSQEVRAPVPKVSAEELHHECTVCGKNFTYDGDHQNLHNEATPHRCSECRK
ncbi:zinc finger protein 585B-like isoform X1 [Notechis scutatus]|uniref:Zinc finger protein 585B-like isoform X1 n=1 Tax=Notechis scutatus TaxID=8663 RepID=A0A6J1VSG1_9SAUR|nr:zinc finger protein 585B-like isoform X1 [Notechis scutatus]XP_026542884.1 zinc finger protein 585B-like isoform X1 [Notechis scutatus]